jgi:hypothetical protein
MSHVLPPLYDTAWQTRHEWVRWVMGEDAQTLLWQLCEWVDDPTLSRDALVDRVDAWQRHATQAVGFHAWTVRVDTRLGICLDERLYLFDMRMRTW